MNKIGALQGVSFHLKEKDFYCIFLSARESGNIHMHVLSRLPVDLQRTAEEFV